MNIGIVGHESAKFTEKGSKAARQTILDIFRDHCADGDPTIVSGHCHLGGIDIWAEDFAKALCFPTLIYPPKTRQWATGYMPRNLQIAKASDIVYVITVDKLPSTYTGMRFNECYHCANRTKTWELEWEKRVKATGANEKHIKSGGCWTAWAAIEKFGKAAIWKVIKNV